MFDTKPCLHDHVRERRNALALLKTNHEVAVALACSRHLQRDQDREDVRVEMTQVALPRDALVHPAQYATRFTVEFATKHAGSPAAGRCADLNLHLRERLRCPQKFRKATCLCKFPATIGWAPFVTRSVDRCVDRFEQVRWHYALKYEDRNVWIQSLPVIHGFSPRQSGQRWQNAARKVQASVCLLNMACYIKRRA